MVGFIAEILTGRDGLHDFVGLEFVVNLQGEEISGGSELELGDPVLLVLFDCDLFGTWKVLLLSSHNLNEFFQIFNLLWLKHRSMRKRRIPLTMILIYI